MIRLISLLICTFSIRLIAQDIQFISENIDFSINSKLFSINGIYTFINTANAEKYQAILFPFNQPIDSLTIEQVYNLTYHSTVNYQPTEKGILFKIYLAPKDTCKINIAYTQKTSSENVYILESTQYWDNPLKEVYYSLILNSSVAVDSFSYKPDTLFNNVYYWTRKNFYPKENFIIWIK